MRVLVGTSGYSYKEWKGRFYPEKMKEADMLPFYAERFPTVEINNTFYRMPSVPLLSRWAERVRAQAWPEAFVFFKHEDEARGPELAAALRARLGGGGPVT